MAASSDDDVNRLRIKEQACLYLAVALLQGLGRLDEAILWWRERKRLAAAIVGHTRGTRRQDKESHSPIFDEFWSTHIGHTALLSVHVKRKLLEGKADYFTLLLPPKSSLGNRYLVGSWESYFHLVERLPNMDSVDYLHYGSKNLYLDSRLLGPETYFWQAYAEISRAWEQAGGGAILELPKWDLLRGRQALTALGLPPRAWYVCLHVRSPGFKQVHDALHDVLNAEIATYHLAIEEVVRRGGWVIRMGDRSMPKLPPMKQVLDYAHSAYKADWMDVYLCGTCSFYIGTSSGLAYVPNLFGIPCVLTNWFPTGTRPLNSTDLFIPKLHWYEARKSPVPFAESLAPPLGHIHARATLRELGVSLTDNSPEDLRDVVVEMLDRLEGTSAYTAADTLLQNRFDAIATQSRSYGNAWIGRDFIRKYQDLLPSGQIVREGAFSTSPQI
jgi:putative glycosyltransferase (TIGR04372 family)